MGSFNDLVIHPLNGDAVDEPDIGPVNRRLAAYRHDIWTAATALRPDLDRR